MGLISFLFGTKKASATKAPVTKHPYCKAVKSGMASKVQPECKEQGEIAEQMDRDYQVQLAVKTFAANLQSATVTVEVTEGDEAAQALADSLKELWDQTLPAMLPAIGYGRVAFEKIFEYDAEHQILKVKSLEAIPYKESEMVLDDHGCFAGIKLNPGKKDEFCLDAKACFWLGLNTTVLEPHGKSMYLGAPHEVWKRRQALQGRYDVFQERLAVQGRIFHTPNTETMEDGLEIDVREDLSNRLAGMKACDDLLLPNSRDDKGNFNYEVTRLAEVLDSSGFLAMITQGETEQLRAFGIPEKTLTEGDAVGSLAMVKQQSLILYAIIDGLLQQFTNSFQRYVIDKVVEMDWAKEVRPTIKITFVRLGKAVDSALVEIAKVMLGAGQLNDLILSGAVNTKELFEKVGVPIHEQFYKLFLSRVKSQQEAQARADAAVQARFGNANLNGPPSPQPGQKRLPSPGQPKATDMAQDFPALPSIPTEDELFHAVMAEARKLWDTFLDACHNRAWRGADAALKELKTLQANSAVAARVLGMLAPFKLKEAKAIDLAVIAPEEPHYSRPQAGRDFTFPFLDDAIDWLIERRAVTFPEFRAMEEAEKRTVFALPGVQSNEIINKLKLQNLESLKNGGTLEEYRQLVQPLLQRSEVADYQVENLFRTTTHQAFISGMNGTLQNERVKTEFPYVLYSATHDGRTRLEHRELDGLVIEIGTPAYGIILRALNDYSCRCSILPVSEEGAAGKRIVREYGDLPADVVAAYGREL